MKGLIIKREWLDLFFDGRKKLEMRRRPTTIRGSILLIQSGSGCVVGSANLQSCSDKPLNDVLMDFHQSAHRVPQDSPFWKTHRYAWHLTNIVKYDKPKPYKHPQGAIVWVNVGYK